MKMYRQKETAIYPKGISLFTEKNDPIGTVFCDGSFRPSPGLEYYPNELKEILTIAENFNLMFNNLKD